MNFLAIQTSIALQKNHNPCSKGRISTQSSFHKIYSKAILIPAKSENVVRPLSQPLSADIIHLADQKLGPQKGTVNLDEFNDEEHEEDKSDNDRGSQVSEEQSDYDVDEEYDNDYAENYFDNGEDDEMDNLGDAAGDEGAGGKLPLSLLSICNRTQRFLIGIDYD